MKKAICVIGTRPEAIKMAPVIHELSNTGSYEPVVISTGQHLDLLSQTLSSLSVSPNYDMHIMSLNQSPGQVIGQILNLFPDFLKKIKPDIVLVQGDTATSYGAAFSSFDNHFKVGHIEAGLRTYNLNEPFPEEALRQMIDRLSNFLFAPTPVSASNLASEHLDKSKIFVTGNTVVDSLMQIQKDLPSLKLVKKTYQLSDKPFILVTAHRRENHGTNLKNIIESLLQIANDNPQINLIYPVHPNPNVSVPVKQLLGNIPNIKLLPPLAYPDFLTLMMNSLFIISDSGGVQEEASVAKRQVILLRDVTERPEGVGVGLTHLAGCDKGKITSLTNQLIKTGGSWEGKSPFGDGKASQKIVQILENEL